MKSGFQALKIWWKDHCHAVVCGLLGLVLLAQFAQVISYATLNADHMAIVASGNDDAGWGVRKAMQTRWWKDNGWAHYGPLYFRLAHSLQYFNHHVAHEDAMTALESFEETAHFTIMTLSVISLFGVAFGLSYLLLSFWPARLALTSAFVAAFLVNEYYARYILIAHPDHMFAIFCLAAAVCTMAWLTRPTELNFAGMGTLWGLATLVKISTSLFTLGFLSLLFPPFNKKSVKRLGAFIGFVALGYFVLGLPQTIAPVDRPLRFLLQESHVSTTSDFANLVRWMGVWWDEIWRPLAVLVLAWIILPGLAEARFSGRAILRMTIFWLLAMAAVMSRKTFAPSEHYLFPLNAIFFLLCAAGLAHLRLPAWRWPVARVFAFLLVPMTIHWQFPATLQSELMKQRVCRPESREIYRVIQEQIAAGRKVWIDPYVPFDPLSMSQGGDVGWQKSLEGLHNSQFTALALSHKYYQGAYLDGAEPSEYARRDNPNWKATREFYSAFAPGQDVTLPDGSRYHMALHNTCGFELWLKE